jgi:hypothetical protein
VGVPRFATKYGHARLTLVPLIRLDGTQGKSPATLLILAPYRKMPIGSRFPSGAARGNRMFPLSPSPCTQGEGRGGGSSPLPGKMRLPWGAARGVTIFRGKTFLLIHSPCTQGEG